MKKVMALILSVMMICGMCLSCGKAETPAESSSPVSDPTEESRSSTADTDATETSATAATETSGTQDETSGAAGTTTVTTKKATTTGGTQVKPTKKESMDYSKYNLDAYMTPIWQGDTVYNETLMFVPDAKTKKIEAAPLLYKPTKILSVRSFDLKTEYVEGFDFVVTPDGCIELTEDSRIPQWKYNDFYRVVPDVYALNSKSAPGRYLKYGDANMANMQVCVTYTHTEKWAGPVPAYQGSTLSRSVKLLSEKKPITIVFNGDSLMEGCDASGGKFNIDPHMPIWPIMATEELRKVYGGTVNYINTAVGGTTSEWGLNEVENNIIKHNPDLVVLGFGTNDGTGNMDPNQYKSNIEQIIAKTRAKNPNCEFILVSSLVPNPDADGWAKAVHHQYPAKLEEIAASNSGVAVVKMYDMQQYVLTKKRYWDMTSNNVNHCTDFFIRFTAQSVAQALIKNVK